MSQQLKPTRIKLLKTDSYSNKNSKKMNFSFRNKSEGKSTLGFFTNNEIGLRDTIINTNYQPDYVRAKLKKELSTGQFYTFRIRSSFVLSGSSITTNAYYYDSIINEVCYFTTESSCFSSNGGISDCYRITLSQT